MRTRQFRLLGAAAFLVTMTAAAGCGDHDEADDRSMASSATSTANSGLNLSADVDPTSSSVILPADRFVLNHDERELLKAAETAAFASCARRIDIPWTGAKPLLDPAYRMWNRFGPWTPQMAGKFGFAPPASDRDLVENGIVPRPDDFVSGINLPNRHLSEEQLAKADECVGDAQSQKFSEQELITRGPWEDELYQTWFSLLNDPRTQKVFDELRACYGEHGMTFDEDTPGLVTEADPGTINEEQITLALKVADCQEEVDLTKRLADIWASLQAPVIEKYADELVAQRARIDKALEEARSYVAQHPELFEAPK